jgi:hypothetical protein
MRRAAVRFKAQGCCGAPFQSSLCRRWVNSVGFALCETGPLFEFIEEAKTSGLVQKAIDRAGPQRAAKVRSRRGWSECGGHNPQGSDRIRIRLDPANQCDLSTGFFASTFLSSGPTCPASQSGLCISGADTRKCAIRAVDRVHRGFRAMHETASIGVLSGVTRGKSWVMK